MRMRKRAGVHVATPPLPGGGPVLVTPTQNAAISVTRFKPNNVGDGSITSMPPEDAHLILFQLQPHPAHDFWVGGKYAPVPETPEATLSILDLAEEPQGRLIAPVDTLMFHVPKTVLGDLAEDVGASKISGLEAPDNWRTEDPVIEQLQPFIVGALSRPEGHCQLLQDHVMLGLGTHFAQVYGGMTTTALRRGGLAPWQEKRAKELLEANLDRELSLQDIANECQLSLAHFSKAFKVSVGLTPHCWLQNCRIARAKDLLTTDLGLADIAATCGFADQSHFTRTFVRMIGVGPGAWRRIRSS
jgi:AraC family transcriptional regulator